MARMDKTEICSQFKQVNLKERDNLVDIEEDYN
jgi:hypothetical protein